VIISVKLINFTNLTIYYSIISTMDKSTDFSKKDIAQITTYQSGIAQAAAHRATNRAVSDFLLRYGITAMQWFMIGAISDSGKAGIRLSDLTRRLDTTLPYVTNTINLLESKGMVQKVSHTGDSRIKLVSITPHYLPTIHEIEDELRDHLRVVLYDTDHISREELQTYISVLYKLAGSNQK